MPVPVTVTETQGAAAGRVGTKRREDGRWVDSGAGPQTGPGPSEACKLTDGTEPEQDDQLERFGPGPAELELTEGKVQVPSSDSDLAIVMVST